MSKGARLYVSIWAVLTVAFLVVLARSPRVDAFPEPDPLSQPPAHSAAEAAGTQLAQADLATAAERETHPAGPSPALLTALAEVAAAAQQAGEYAALQRDRSALHEAAHDLRRDPEAALEVAERLLEVPQDEALRGRAEWIAGEAYAALGHYEEALAAWDRVGDTPADDYLELRRIHALLGLGRADEAARRAGDLLENLPDPADYPQHEARELLLQGLYDGHSWDTFIDEAWSFLERYPDYPRRDQLLLWIGRAETARGQLNMAVAAYDRVVWDFPFRPTAAPAWLSLQALGSAGVELPRHSLAERFDRAQHLRSNKHWAIADAALGDLLRDALAGSGEGSFANEVRYERARNAYNANDYEAARGHLEDILATDRAGVARYDVYTLLSDTHARLGLIEQGVEDIRERESGRSRARLHEELAEYYFENGGYAASLEHYEEIRSSRREHSWDHTLLEFMAGRYEPAAEGFADLAEHATGNTWARNRYFEGRAEMELGDYQAARTAFEEVLTSRGELNYYGLQAQNRIVELDRSDAPVLVAEAEAPAALPAAPVLEASMASDFLRQVDVQLTALVRRQVELPPAPAPDEAGSRFEAPARLYWDGPDGVPDTHLALLASGQEIQGAYLAPADAEAPDHLATTYGDMLPDLARAAYLYDVGQWREAWQEARDATMEFRGLDRAFGHRRPSGERPIALSFERFGHFIDNRAEDTGLWGIEMSGRRFPVPEDRTARRVLVERQGAIFDVRDTLREDLRDGLMTLGDYHMVRRFARETPGWREVEPDDAHAELWSEVFPRAYPELVTDYAGRWEVNPYLIWALMHVESSFNPDSISRADARGLLQVIPKTGELIAERLGYWDFGPSNLMDPELSIEFGCYYFSQLMTKFHGQELLAFAAYNGGPHQVARWLEGRGDLPLDAFIETIPFEQAREYAKKVYRFVALYRRLYLGQDDLYVGNVIDRVYENNIHF